MIEGDTNLPVRHYTEVLQFPFCWSAQSQNFEVQLSKSTQDLISCLEAAQEDWHKLPNWLIEAVDLKGELLAKGKPSAKGTTSEKKTWTDWQHYQALSYFHPAVRSFLFGSHTVTSGAGAELSTNDYLTVFRHKKVKHLEVEVKTNTPFKLKFKVVRCDLLLMQPNVGVLQLELCGEAQATDSFGQAMVCKLGELLTARDQLRRLYPPYLDAWEENKGTVYSGGHFALSIKLLSSNDCELSKVEMNPATLNDFWDGTFADDRVPQDVQRGPAMAAPWAYLLKAVSDQFKIMPDSDERLPSMAFVAVNNPRQISRGNWMRLAFADERGGDVLPYARDFVVDFEERFCYDRFWLNAADSSDWPSRILNSGYAFTYVGSAQDEFFFCKLENGAYATFRQIYVRMGLMVFFQKMALNSTLARVSWLANGKVDEEQLFGRAQKLYQEFLDFTRIYWFIEVSPQVQGVELFDRWMRHVRNPQIYSEVRQELGDFVMFLDAQANQRQADEVHRLTRVATVLGGLGVWAGLLGMNIWPIEAGHWNEGPWSWSSFFLSFVAMFVCAGLPLLLVSCLISVPTKVMLQPRWRCLKKLFR